MSQGPLCPNLSQKVQKEVSQMANHNLSPVILLGGLSVNLNHLKIMEGFWAECEVLMNQEFDLCLFSVDEDIIFRNDLPSPTDCDRLMIIDQVIPILRKQLEKMAFSKKAILIHNKVKKDIQQE